MFGSSASELILVFVIGLLILGPERLPRVAAQIGRWVAKARRTANQLRYQLEREVALDEIYKAKKSKPQARPAAQQPAAGAGAAGSTTESAASSSDVSAPADAETAGEDAGPVSAGESVPIAAPEVESASASASTAAPTPVPAYASDTAERETANVGFAGEDDATAGEGAAGTEIRKSSSAR